MYIFKIMIDKDIYILIYGVILVCNENTHENIRSWCELV